MSKTSGPKYSFFCHFPFHKKKRKFPVIHTRNKFDIINYDNVNLFFTFRGWIRGVKQNLISVSTIQKDFLGFLRKCVKPQKDTTSKIDKIKYKLTVFKYLHYKFLQHLYVMQKTMFAQLWSFKNINYYNQQVGVLKSKYCLLYSSLVLSL